MDSITDPADASRILVIDDSEDIHRLLVKKLGDEGHRVYSAYNGTDGIASARDCDPSLILLDLSMPGIDGFEVLRELKEDESVMHAPIILISGSEDTQDLVMGLDLGAVDFIHKPFDFSELRARVRAAIRVNKLMRMLAQRAQIDGLTELWNRSYFDTRLASEVSECARSNTTLCLALCDIDHFKSVNDRYGHPAGDAALEGFAKLLLNELRQHDVACRYGGEEFAVILRNTSVEDATNVIERIRQRVELQIWPRHPEHQLTVSFGLASMNAASKSTTADDLVTQADAALYAAKETGRNRLVVNKSGVVRKAS